MLIQFQSEGGVAYFPGLSQPVTVDTGQLPADQAAAVEGLVHTARFFDRSAQQRSAPPGAADYRQYTITVDDGGRRHTIRVDEPVDDPDLQRLVEYLTSQARASRAARRGAGGMGDPAPE